MRKPTDQLLELFQEEDPSKIPTEILNAKRPSKVPKAYDKALRDVFARTETEMNELIQTAKDQIEEQHLKHAKEIIPYLYNIAVENGLAEEAAYMLIQIDTRRTEKNPFGWRLETIIHCLPQAPKNEDKKKAGKRSVVVKRAKKVKLQKLKKKQGIKTAAAIISKSSRINKIRATKAANALYKQNPQHVSDMGKASAEQRWPKVVLDNDAFKDMQKSWIKSIQNGDKDGKVVVVFERVDNKLTYSSSHPYDREKDKVT